MTKKTIAQKLVELRTRNNLTQRELSENINYSDKVISKWERGESIPDIHAIEIITKYYSISIDDFMEGIIDSNNNKDSGMIKIEAIKVPSTLTKVSILVFVVFFISSFWINLITWIIASVFLLIYIFVYGILISKSEWIVEYKNSKIKIVTSISKVRMYIDDILVDEAYSITGTYLLFGKIDNQRIKIRVSYIFINIRVIAFLD